MNTLQFQASKVEVSRVAGAAEKLIHPDTSWRGVGQNPRYPFWFMIYDGL